MSSLKDIVEEHSIIESGKDEIYKILAVGIVFLLVGLAFLLPHLEQLQGIGSLFYRLYSFILEFIFMVAEWMHIFIVEVIL